MDLLDKLLIRPSRVLPSTPVRRDSLLDLCKLVLSEHGVSVKKLVFTKKISTLEPKIAENSTKTSGKVLKIDNYATIFELVALQN